MFRVWLQTLLAHRGKPWSASLPQADVLAIRGSVTLPGDVGITLGMGSTVTGSPSDVILLGGVDGPFHTLSFMVVGSTFLRNFLFLRVTRRLPSNLTLYCQCPCFSTTVPDLSQRVGLGPVWFWMDTWSPTLSGARFLVLSSIFSLLSARILAIPSSLW